MIEFLLGFLAGIFLTGMLLANRKPIESAYERIEPILKAPSPGAEFFEPASTVSEAITEVIKENERRGEITRMDEL